MGRGGRSRSRRSRHGAALPDHQNPPEPGQRGPRCRDFLWFPGLEEGADKAFKEFEELHPDAQAKLLVVIQRFQQGLLRRKDFDKIEGEVWELRVEYLNNPQRILFFKWGVNAVALTCFHKKDQKTPRSKVKLADARRREWIELHGPA